MFRQTDAKPQPDAGIRLSTDTCLLPIYDATYFRARALRSRSIADRNGKDVIIDRCELIQTRDVARVMWARIGQFQNIEHTQNVIAEIHHLPKNQLHNARRQAQQIKYCLAQAKEYLNAASSVSLATRPVLLYYGAMSMALVEILLKQTGESRLSALRQDHNCHGLQLTVSGIVDPSNGLYANGTELRAKVQYGGRGDPKGTFEVWRRSARELPLPGFITTRFARSKQSGYAVIYFGSEVAPPILPKDGITLLDCLSNLPYLNAMLIRLGCKLDMVRGTVSHEINDETDSGKVTYIIHPTSPETLSRFISLIRCPAECVNNIEIIEAPSGIMFSQQTGGNKALIHSLPYAISLDQKNTYFSCNALNLGEFGFLYAALHIAGNFARYYPDIWLKHIEICSPLSLIIDEMCEHAIERLPLLLASELDRKYYVLET